MGSPFIGEIRMFGGNFAPAGWSFCMGQLLPISENDALFALIGTTYGGDGQSTFALPDLQGRVPVHQGTALGITYTPGEIAGVENVTLTSNQMPSHNHAIQTATAAQGGAAATPANNTVLADEALNPAPNPPPAAYLPFNNTGQTALAPISITPQGGSQPHDNMQPFLTVSFIISRFGIFPSRN
jgi:microcystin-dependent protein